jgi:hypothetical protein
MSLSQHKTLQLAAGAVAVVVLYQLLTTYGNRSGSIVEKADQLGGSGPTAPLSDVGPSLENRGEGGNEASVQGIQGRVGGDIGKYANAAENTLSQLLPKGSMGAGAGVAPVSASDLTGQNFMDASHHAAVDVIGVSQTKRNISYDIRTEVPNPTSSVSPWSNTTIQPDVIKNGRPLEGLAA